MNNLPMPDLPTPDNLDQVKHVRRTSVVVIPIRSLSDEKASRRPKPDLTEREKTSDAGRHFGRSEWPQSGYPGSGAALGQWCMVQAGGYQAVALVRSLNTDTVRLRHRFSRSGCIASSRPDTLIIRSSGTLAAAGASA
jgi:hypothetical protein